ncbi:major facilitator superfamily MFS_1 [Desulfovibrio sp. X2]|uniref:MFS transporter n=1 Tax=Desulfovibrio sp. X2 TaxID=941449 RepID=UPI0003588DB2|nr:MFS transporter [Desulfovibrio sp. X2]EPR43946.1 major facilitator superfamily MFS_1 [Desulfovibrio sp. X2]
MAVEHPQGGGAAYRAALPALLLTTFCFFSLFLARVVVGPLMVPIEAALHASHTEAGACVLMIGLGAMLTMLGNGFVSGPLGHRATVVAALLLGATGSFTAAGAHALPRFMAGLFGVGLGAGLYMPSAISIITHVVRREDWGSAIGTHEAAPNSGFILAPLAAEAALALSGWREAYMGLGSMLLLAAVLFALRGPGRGLAGTTPNPALLKEVLRTPAFWIMAALFGLAVGTTIGPYNMLPLALVHEHGYSRADANTLLSLSRLSGVFAAYAAGKLTDRFGPRRTILGVLLLSGLTTAGIGLFTGRALVLMVLLQPIVAVGFFPAGFTAISQIFDWRTRSVALSGVTPVGAAVGSGLIPVAMGWLGDHATFSLGFLGLGACLLAAIPLARRLPRPG